MWSLLFVLLSSLDRSAVLSRAADAEDTWETFFAVDGTSCATMSPSGENLLYQVSDGAEAVRSLVSPAGKLVGCSVAADPAEAKALARECVLGPRERRAGPRRRLEARFTRAAEAKAACREFTERSEREGQAQSLQEDEVPKRSKRGFTYPGTLWCGAGNMADDYNQLGEFAETDSCCRVHDHCPHVIHAFSSNYGHTNFKWHSISHCDCDNDLKACLRKVNDTSSRVVGQAFFNVISVPCFDFTYEERCAERRWYGLCKRYEKLPVAVLREAVPYDYGGIDVIDELAVAPPKRKDPEKINEEEQPEGVTQSAMPSPEEPSLGNVVTAAEDFIKVLATVSSSQSSNADSNKDAAQSTEKKKKKKKKKEKEKEKKANRRPKGKGKERKRKQKAKDGDAVSPPGSRAEEVLSLSNFIRESNRLDGSNTNRPDENKLQLRGEDEPSNDVMKDEPAADVSITSPPAVRKGPAEATKEEEPLNVTSPHAENGRGGNEKKKSNELLHPSSEDLELDTDSLDVSHPVTEPQWLLAVGAARAPTLTPKVKRSRSKERGDNGGRKKRKRVGLDAAIVPAEQPNASADSLKVIPPNGVPAAPPVPPSAQQALQGPHVHGRSSRVTASAFSVLKRRRSKERALRSRRRNSSENLLSPHGGSATPRPGVAQGTQETETGTPTVRSDLRWDPDRRQTQPSLKQTKAAAEDPSSGAPWTTTSAAPSVSWLQLSIQRAKAQFNKKKRRKASHSDRQR